MCHPSEKPITILLVDDHAVIREGLRMLIEGNSNLKITGQAENASDAIRLAAQDQPDIILLDIDLGREDGLDSLPELQKAAPKARVLVLTGATDPETLSRAMRLGAMGLVSKVKAGAVLLKAIEKVHAGEVWFDRAIMGSVLSDLSRKGKDKAEDPEEAKIKSLTERELEVVVLLAEGLKNKDIAARLFISETTVRHHLTSIFSKLEVDDRLELLIYSFRHGLVALPG